jgi:hypothetical protein
MAFVRCRRQQADSCSAGDVQQVCAAAAAAVPYALQATLDKSPK